jgi:hypothetical protein
MAAARGPKGKSALWRMQWICKTTVRGRNYKWPPMSAFSAKLDQSLHRSRACIVDFDKLRHRTKWCPGEDSNLHASRR